jgi:hypothetical protein
MKAPKSKILITEYFILFEKINEKQGNNGYPKILNK